MAGNDDQRLIAHLGLLQGVIARQAQNSFALKGWSLTIASAGIAIGASDSTRWAVPLVALLATLAFGALDAMYLRTERAYRELYNQVRAREEGIDFSMDAGGLTDGFTGWLSAWASWSVAGLYVSLAVVLVVAAIVLCCSN